MVPTPSRGEFNRIENNNSHLRTGQGKYVFIILPRNEQRLFAKNDEGSASVSMLVFPFTMPQKLKGSKCCVYAM